jgi:2-(1,2-epoxy-1,2-dihydrophenyl)acetyl-CoA isomerase
MGYDTITLERAQGIATITLNRPEAYNALTLTLARELFGAVLEVDEDPAVRCVVLTGAGRAFCGGGDVKEFAQSLPRVGILLKELTTFIHGVVSRLVRTPKPVITAVNGVAAGGGLALALAGDLVIAAESARFTMAYSRIAATPDGSSTYWLPRLCGIRRAAELFYTNRVLTAKEAVDWGIATRALPDAEFTAAVKSLAAELAQGPTLALGRGKRLFHLSTTESLETQMEHESQAIAQSSHTEDFAEGVRAFAEKRPPTFHGR